jgi:ABC-2 type transport system ATP-binding protein
MIDIAIRADNLVRTFGERKRAIRAVDGISFEVSRGSIFGLLGPNGAGKSTIVRMLTTILRPTSGTACILGFDVRHHPLQVRRQIAVVLQETAVETLLSVRDNLVIFGRLHGLSGTELIQRTDTVLDQFDLREKQKEKAQDLSIGMRRRLQVAKVFLSDAPVIFLDEATTGMDPIIKRQTLDSIRALAKNGRTVFLTTQLLEEAEELCDHIVILNHGKAVASGTLHMLRALTLKRFHVSIAFSEDGDGPFEALKELQPLKFERSVRSAEMMFEGEEASILQKLSSLSQRWRIERFEVHGVSLEEIFVELLGKETNQEPFADR